MPTAPTVAVLEPLTFRPVAREAAARWGLRRARLSALHFGENITYRVRPDRGGDRLLRVHRPTYHSAQEVASELEWLRSLRRSTGLDVPEPCALPGGEELAAVPVASGEAPHVCTMLRWIQGRHQWSEARAWPLRALGRTMAQLHRHALQWDPPPAFRRAILDWNGLLSRSSNWGELPFELPELFPAGSRPLVLEALDRIGAAIRRLESLPASRALIHADLHLGNVIFSRGQACPIDFDDCGFGFLVYDVATALSAFHGTTRWAQARDALLEGYVAERALPAEQLELLPEFLAVRSLTMAIWMTKRAPLIPRLASHLDRCLAAAVERCRWLLQA